MSIKNSLLSLRRPAAALLLLAGTLPAQKSGVIRINQGPVHSIQQVSENTKSLDWSGEQNLITFERVARGNYFQVHLMKPDGSSERCLTCDASGVAKKHNGNPSWHPSGKYIVFTSEIGDTPRNLDKWAVPGRGLNCNLWVITPDGRKAYQLTDLPLRTGADITAVIHPQFSPDGRMLIWAERTGGGGSWGNWVLKTATFSDTSGQPKLSNIQTHELAKPSARNVSAPAQQQGRRRGILGRLGGGRNRQQKAGNGDAGNIFYETHDVSKDGSRVLFSANLEEGQQQYGLDIYEYNLNTRSLKRLTKTPDQWDEHAHYSPDGSKIIWMSSNDLNVEWGDATGDKWTQFLKTELWMMDADGSHQERLTHFNQKGSPEYFGRRTIVSDNTFSPDGKSILVTAAYENGQSLLSKCFLLRLD